MSQYKVDGRSGNLIGGNLVGGTTTTTVLHGQPTTSTTTYTTTEYIQPTATISAGPAVTYGATTAPVTYSTVPVGGYVSSVQPATVVTAVQPSTVAYTTTPVVTSQVGLASTVGVGAVGAVSTGEIIKGKEESYGR